MKAEGGKPELCALFFVEFRIRNQYKGQRTKNKAQSSGFPPSAFILHPSTCGNYHRKVRCPVRMMRAIDLHFSYLKS
jgi:hypothetical protein